MEDPTHEWVLLVPPQLAQSSHKVLVKADCVAKPWHFEGRFGSRTHKDGDTGTIGIPVISQERVNQQSQIFSDLGALLEMEGVELRWKSFTPSNRAVRKLPYYDARIHPERASSTSAKATAANPTTSVNLEQAPPLFTYMDLFAGIGGFAVALDALGGECILASEIDPACQRFYRHNFPTAPLRGDIYQIETPTDYQQKLPRVDLLVGGFPCQPFSALGAQPGLECSKGHLFLEIVRLLEAYKPKAFLLENVPGLLAMTDTFTTIVEAFKRAGYSVTHEVCNARALTATSRKRLFVVGLLKETITAQSTTAPASTTDKSQPFEFPFIPDLQLKAHDVIDYTNQELSDIERQVLPLLEHQVQTLNKSKRWKPADLAWPNTVCNTLVSHYGNSITRGESQLVPCSATTVPTSLPRRFSPRECLRIMGFPNSYKLPPRPNDSKQGDMAFCKEQYRMAGNAVCPPLMAALAGAVLDRVLSVLPPQDEATSPDDTSNPARSSWVEWGRHVAIKLAYQATRTGRPTGPGPVMASNGDLPSPTGDGQTAIYSPGSIHGVKRHFDCIAADHS